MNYKDRKVFWDTLCSLQGIDLIQEGQKLRQTIKTPKALRKKLCKFKNCDKNVMMERLENSRSDFFTVYNGYCNLSRFFGYQPDGMERSGMESG